MTDHLGPSRKYRLNDAGEYEEVDAPYRINVHCDAGHYLRTFTSTRPKESDDRSTPMGWHVREPEVLIAGSAHIVAKGAVRQHQSSAGRFKFRCPACKDAPLEVRAEKLFPILDTLARSSVDRIGLRALAARV